MMSKSVIYSNNNNSIEILKTAIALFLSLSLYTAHRIPNRVRINARFSTKELVKQKRCSWLCDELERRTERNISRTQNPMREGGRTQLRKKSNIKREALTGSSNRKQEHHLQVQLYVYVYVFGFRCVSIVQIPIHLGLYTALLFRLNFSQFFFLRSFNEM